MYHLQKIMLPSFNHKVELYLLSFDLNIDVLFQEGLFLTDDEIKKSRKFRNHSDRMRFVITRSSLKKILARYLNINEPLSIEIGYDDYGKPLLLPDNNLHFNVSHSGNKAVIAISRHHKVGVDIECRSNFHSTITEVSDYIFSEKEYRIQDSYSIDDIYMKWVIKESVLKATGYGLSYDMSSFSIFQSSNNHQDFYIEDIPDSWEILRTLCMKNESYILALTITNEIF